MWETATGPVALAGIGYAFFGTGHGFEEVFQLLFGWVVFGGVSSHSLIEENDLRAPTPRRTTRVLALVLAARLLSREAG